MAAPFQTSLFSARPLVAVTLAFATGVALATAPMGLPVATGGALGGLAMAAVTRRAFWRSVALLMGFLAAGAWRANLAFQPADDDVSRFVGAGYVTLRGTIAGDVDVAAYFLLCRIAVVQVTLPDGRTFACGGRVAVRMRRKESGYAPDYGDAVEVRGPLERPDSARNPGGYDRAAYLSHRQVFAELTARRESAWRVVPASPPPAAWLPRLAARCRASLERTFHALLPSVEADLLTGILLGSRTRLPPQVSDDFTVTGTGHILASSGMNVAVIAALVALLCRLVRIPRKAFALLTLPALAFYTLLAGAKPSIVRADLMASLFLLGYLLDREGDGPTALAAAALILLLAEPGNLFDAGFQLSFVIVMAALVVMPLFKTAWRRRKPHDFSSPKRGASPVERLLTSAGDGLALTVVAGIASAPLTAQHFNQISPIGFLANALILPPIALLFAAGFLVWLGSLVWFNSAQLLAAACLSPCLAYLIGAARFCAELPGAVLAIPSPGWPLIALCYAALGAGVWWLHGKGQGREV